MRGACFLIHSNQYGHQEPEVSVALLIQSSISPSTGPPVQNWYLGLFGELTTPAIWPDPASTKSTGPPKDFDPRNTERAGAIWSSLVARLKIGAFTFFRSSLTPSISISPLVSLFSR